MNAPLIPVPIIPQRHSVAAIMELAERGIIAPYARFELIRGEVREMSAKGRHHEIARETIELWLDQPWRAGRFNVIREHTLVLDQDTFVEPDFLLYDASRRIADAPLTPADVRLLIETADTSWAYDQ